MSWYRYLSWLKSVEYINLGEWHVNGCLFVDDLDKNGGISDLMLVPCHCHTSGTWPCSMRLSFDILRNHMRSFRPYSSCSIIFPIKSTIWLFNIAMENGPLIEVYLLIAWWFSMAMLNNQMVALYGLRPFLDTHVFTNSPLLPVPGRPLRIQCRGGDWCFFFFVESAFRCILMDEEWWFNNGYYGSIWINMD